MTCKRYIYTIIKINTHYSDKMNLIMLMNRAHIKILYYDDMYIDMLTGSSNFTQEVRLYYIYYFFTFPFIFQYSIRTKFGWLYSAHDVYVRHTKILTG